MIFPPTSFWRSGVQLSKKMELVALAMKSIAPLLAVTPAPAARVSAITESAATSGIEPSGGPPGFPPPTLTSISRALSFVHAQLRKNAAQSGFFDFAATT